MAVKIQDVTRRSRRTAVSHFQDASAAPAGGATATDGPEAARRRSSAAEGPVDRSDPAAAVSGLQLFPARAV